MNERMIEYNVSHYTKVRIWEKERRRKNVIFTGGRDTRFL